MAEVIAAVFAAGLGVVFVVLGALRMSARHQTVEPTEPEPPAPQRRPSPAEPMPADDLLDVAVCADVVRSAPPHKWPVEPSARDRALGAPIRIPRNLEEV